MPTFENPPIAFDFTLAADLSATISRLTAEVYMPAHGFVTGRRINIRGADQPKYNGDHTIAVTGPDTFTFPVSVEAASPATGSIIVNAGPVLPTDTSASSTISNS